MLGTPPISDEAGLRGGFALGAYRAVTAALEPVLPLLLRLRAARGKEDRARLSERRGFAARPRPQGTLVWIHGVSVGESLAALPLAAKLLEPANRHVLSTSGTVTAARLMAERLPPGAIHHYVPLDSPQSVRRFLSHWQPDLALFIESELWPNLVLETRARKIPMVLVNARISERSARNWRRAPKLARALLSAFDVCLVQDETIAARLAALGARNIRVTGSLKADAPPLPVDQAALADFLAATGGRPLFVAASTHPGEEEIVFEVTRMLRDAGEDGLTVIIPRHPDRGAAIADLAAARGFCVARRAAGALPCAQTQIYIADTLGELGLFYRAAPFAFVGGSLVPHGGQNPLEPARLGTAVLTGPHTTNFAETFRAVLGAQGTGCTRSAGELFSLVRSLHESPARAAKLGAKAKAAAQSLSGALARTHETAEQLLTRHARA